MGSGLQLTASIGCAGLKWSHISRLCLCRVDFLVLYTAQQGDSYLSQLLNAGQINTSPPLQGEEDNSTAANSFSLSQPAGAPAKSTMLQGIPSMNRCSVGGVGPSLGLVSELVLSARCVRAGEDRLARLSCVMVSSGLSTGNYGGEKAIRQCWAAQWGGRAHAQRGGEFFHRRDQSSVKQSADPGPWFSGKSLGHWFRAPQLSRISRDTILKTERGNTARRQHQCMCARSKTHSHTASLFLLPSPSRIQNPPTAGRRATAIAILP